MTVFTLLCSRMPDRIHDEVRHFITKWTPLVAAYFNPYVHLTISEQSDEQFRRNELFDDISAYLTDKCAGGARWLKAELGKDGRLPEITLDDGVQVTDDSDGARIWWYATNKGPSYRSPSAALSLFPADTEPRLFRAVFHKRHRRVVLDNYLPRALAKGHDLIADMARQRRLFTNHRPGNRSTWCHVPFEHPATFDKLALEPVLKKEIIDDLEAFMDGKQYYSDVGKAWKRGTTLSSGRKLFIETKGRSIIVIEDIDAIEVDLAGNRKVADKKAGSSSCCDHLALDPNKDDGSKVTLSGLLSFVDGLWSASGGERIIVFTTNRVDMLDQALTRRGRMDLHIEMSYCRFGAFKVLANNYLKVTDHELFGEIRQLLDDTDMSPADVAHNLMPKSKKRKWDDDMPPADVAYYLKRDTDACLAGLVATLKKAKRESTDPTIEVVAPAQHETSK
ncbi:unnamed protein product [Alopecurus aequalis]